VILDAVGLQIIATMLVQVIVQTQDVDHALPEVRKVLAKLTRVVIGILIHVRVREQVHAVIMEVKLHAKEILVTG
jgi:hypothetical protein